MNNYFKNFFRINILILSLVFIVSANAFAELAKLATAGDNLILATEAQRGNIKEVKRLLDKKTDPNSDDMQGYTALYWAAAGGYLDMAKLLVDRGANVNLNSCPHKWTALMGAAANGHADVVNYLIAKGADINLTDEYGYDAYYYAVRNHGEESVVALMLEMRIDLSRKEYHKAEVAIDKAESLGYNPDPKFIEEFKRQADKSDEFAYAIVDNDIQRVKEMISQGADVNAKSAYFDQDALSLCGCDKDVADLASANMARLFIDKGANVNARNSVSWTHLMEAAWNNCMEMARVLIENGANVNATERDGFTALMLAAKAGNNEMVKLLISQGADVNAKRSDGGTALFLAGRFGHNDTAQLLRQYGATE